MASANFKKKINAVNSDARPLVLLEISHTNLTQPIRVVNDYENVTSNGHEFIALAFRITLPDQTEGNIPKARLEIDNIGKELVGWLEISDGGEGAKVRMMLVLRSAPNTIEWEATLDLTNVSITQNVVSGDLSYKNILQKQGFRKTYRPASHPGLF